MSSASLFSRRCALSLLGHTAKIAGKSAVLRNGVTGKAGGLSRASRFPPSLPPTPGVGSAHPFACAFISASLTRVDREGRRRQRRRRRLARVETPRAHHRIFCPKTFRQVPIDSSSIYRLSRSAHELALETSPATHRITHGLRGRERASARQSRLLSCARGALHRESEFANQWPGRETAGNAIDARSVRV